MLSVSFRFYAALNDFLPTARRYIRFVHTLRERASVKDTIEALGVPHPEVGLILVNGIPSDFQRRLDRGDDVAVYPEFQSIDLAGVRRVGEPIPSIAKFALDGHLRKLASLLRLAGFDSVVVDDDRELAETGGREERIVLTRDLALLKRSSVRHGYWVRHTDPEWQFAEILDRFALAGCITPFVRCMRCNAPVASVPAATVADRLLPCTRQAFTDFHQCAGCGRVYWKGSHYEQLQRVLDRAVARAMTPRFTG